MQEHIPTRHMSFFLPAQLDRADREAFEEIRRRKLKGMPDDEEITSRTLSLAEMEMAKTLRWPFTE